MKILVIGDPHFKKEKIEMMTNICNEIIQIVINNDINQVICLGDVLDKHSIIHLMPLYQASDFFFELSKYCPVYILVGNHDRINNSDFLSKYSSLYSLKNTPNIHIIDSTFWDKDTNLTADLPLPRLYGKIVMLFVV